MQKILLIDDDQTFTKIVDVFLSKKGFKVSTAYDLRSAEKMLQSEKYNLLLIDYRLPDGTGLDLISKMKSELAEIPCIMLTSLDDVRTAVKSIQSGASEYITKPVNPDELLLVIHTALKKSSEPKADFLISSPFIKGESEAARKLYEHVELVAPTDMSVMIIGESGTGKEHIAQAIHQKSKRSNEPFVAVDCGVLSKELAASELFGHTKGAFTGALQDKTGVLEQANGGTLFLDEIGNLSYDVQIKLLRTLQERTIQPVGSNKTIPINIRLITATNEILSAEIENGNFRGDIYHRINEFQIQMPTLKDRGRDLELFIKHFIEKANQELDRTVKVVSRELLTIFYSYDWPGNLRELKNVVRRLVLLSKSDSMSHEFLPAEMNSKISLNKSNDLKTVQEINEREMIANVLVQTRHNKTQAAKLLNIDRKTLYHKMEKYALE